jgi:hypothetical protein
MHKAYSPPASAPLAPVPPSASVLPASASQVTSLSAPVLLAAAPALGSQFLYLTYVAPPMPIAKRCTSISFTTPCANTALPLLHTSATTPAAGRAPRLRGRARTTRGPTGERGAGLRLASLRVPYWCRAWPAPPHESQPPPRAVGRSTVSSTPPHRLDSTRSGRLGLRCIDCWFIGRRLRGLWWPHMVWPPQISYGVSTLTGGGAPAWTEVGFQVQRCKRGIRHSLAARACGGGGGGSGRA